MDTRASGDKNPASDNFLGSVNLVDPHHFCLEKLHVLVRRGVLTDLQLVVLPDLYKYFTFLQMAISVNNTDKGARILKHDSILFSHEKQLVDLLSEVNGGKNWVTLDVDALKDGILELLFEVVQIRDQDVQV